MERRLQTNVFKLSLTTPIHHARVLIRQRHIRVCRQMVNIPSILVRTDREKHIDFALTSPFGSSRGRVKRKGKTGGDDMTRHCACSSMSTSSPEECARAIAKAMTHCEDAEVLAEVSTNMGETDTGVNLGELVVYPCLSSSSDGHLLLHS